MEELTRRCLVQILNHDIFHCQRRSVGVVTCLLCFCSSELLTLETTRLSTLHIDMLDSEIKSASKHTSMRVEKICIVHGSGC